MSLGSFLRGVSLNRWERKVADVVDLLHVTHETESDSTLFSKSTSGYESFLQKEDVAVTAQQMLVVVSVASCSGSNTGDVWQITHEIGGSRPATDEQSQFKATVSDTGGRRTPVTSISVWKGLTAGLHDVDLVVAPVSGPTGSFYARPYYMHIFALPDATS